MSMKAGAKKSRVQEHMTALDLYFLGFTVYEIGFELNRCPSTVAKWLRSYEQKMRRPGVRSCEPKN